MGVGLSSHSRWLLRPGLLWECFYFPIRKVIEFTEESWLCKNTEGWLTALCGWGCTRHIWLWFVYVCCQWSPLSRTGLDRARSSEWHETKWVCDAGVWLCTSHACYWLVSSRMPSDNQDKILRCFQSDMKWLSRTFIDQSVNFGQPS